MAIRAVIFDLGGVVLGSPLHAIAALEREHGIPAGFVNRVVVDTGRGGRLGAARARRCSASTASRRLRGASARRRATRSPRGG